MARTDLPLPQLRKLGETKRRDAWWAQPLVVFLGLAAAVIYLTWAAFQGVHYWHDGGAEAAWQSQYLSPAYSPVLFRYDRVEEGGAMLEGVAPPHHSWFGEWPTWLPKRLPLVGILITPAFLILWWGPGLFRLTCYYYRGAYYKAFWADPLNCSVGEPPFRGENYRGERWFPLVLQNIHRYALYIAIGFIGVLSYDAILSFIWVRHDPITHEITARTFGVGLGSLVLTLNVILLAGYTFGCHSLRHLVGGGIDILSRRPIRRKTYDCVSCLNRGHMQWAWLSLIWVCFADLYVRLASLNEWNDAIFVIGG